jgi:Ca-activated chloride channel family protein
MEADGVSLDRRPLEVTLDKMGSREMILAVLNGSVQPDLIGPASSLQRVILESLSTSRHGVPILNRSNPSLCRPVLRTPLVIAYSKERGGVLRGFAPGPRLWPSFHNALVDPRGWGACGHPEWGFAKVGQTDPLVSNSGSMAILLMAYDYSGRTEDLTTQDLPGDADYQAWFAEFQSYSAAPFAHSTGPPRQDMITIGPSRYDFVAPMRRPPSSRSPLPPTATASSP